MNIVSACATLAYYKDHDLGILLLDVKLNQKSQFEAKVANGNGEQTLNHFLGDVLLFH